ncbi:hypothetical protein PFLUV_G00159390 [Perca fluviatilis]|uniref:Uncharacterized protein n=1 Tax=Perca fluviatilis TaxID=8168 RepID=A0A6A5ET72_PERFL|nr:uncharacterized protein LOC120571488 isoform X1 [Perca fluviatilis]XP_039676388.1 uncharacterized protein LOC120571488 isoform X1 [Perca fluviatilis]KAF1381955.1 hypothetical protein PFLUV_G00159390 [Perca fluviatilis]
MKVISAAVLSALFCTVVSASLKVKKEEKTAFFGEDIHIDVPPGNLGEVVFIPRTNRSSEVVLLRAGVVVTPRGHLNSLGHLVLEDMQEEDEGEYIIKNTNNPNAAKHLTLVVRDCSLEQVVKYGETYYIHLNQVEGPITLEFRPGLVQANHSEIHGTTEPPPVVLYNQTAVLPDYAGRLSVSEKRVTLHSVRMTDEGSFTVLDREGKVKRRNCLNVREHQNFLHPSHGENLKVKLYRPHANVNIVYRPKSGNQDRVILDQGVLATPLDPLLEGRLTVEGSELSIKKVQVADSGVFKVTDLDGFPVAHVYIEVEAYKLPPLTVAILSLLSVIAFMLLVCLLSCVYRMHKRNEKNKKLILIAQQAGKGDGEAFRQVVHEAYNRFAEESLMHSVSERPTESTEVTIKGLEVSKPGRYHTLSSDNFLEMSDSGVEFTSSGLPLDSDTDAMTYASHKPLLNAVFPTAMTEEVHIDSPEATLAPHGDLSASRTPDSAMSASPASNPRSLAAATPDGSLHGAVSPGAASRGTAGSDLAKTEGGADCEEAGQKEESAQST